MARLRSMKEMNNIIKTKSITNRWLINSLSLILIILLILSICFAFVVRNYFYSGIQQTIKGRASEIAWYFSDYMGSAEDFNNIFISYVENFKDKNQMEIMAINNEDNVIITSTGFAPSNEELKSDYMIAKQAKGNYGVWIGRLSSGEKVISATQSVFSTDGKYLGSMRYIVSLENVGKRVFFFTIIVVLISLLIIFFVTMSSLYFIKSIVNPVTEIGETAKRIAHGDFNARLYKEHDDEIGDLCDTINYMASELAASDKMKNDFISSVSHELRTPLTAIKGWAETMKLSGGLDINTMDKGLGIIVKETERLSGIVEELLDFSRMQNKRMVLMMDKIDIVAELDEAIYMYKERAESENKHLVFDCPDIAYPVLGDKNRLKQVFVNVIDNALKYTPEGGIINIFLERDGNMLHIIINDSGCGIPAEHLPRIKEKFYKVNQTQRGSGIGLAVADEIMNLHSGSLVIESEEGVGTTVVISIPLIQSEVKALGC